MTVKNFFSKEEQEELIEAIQSAELDTSGEVRLHLELECVGDPVKRAEYWFDRLGMSKTEHRNGVLFYLSVKSRKFAVVGDIGIHEKVGDDFWNMIKNIMLEQFYNEHFKDGLVKGIELTGRKLREFFPYQSDDVNELPDDISFGE